MISVLVSYLKFHYGRAYFEGAKMLAPHGLALIVIGIPLAIVWALLPLIIGLFFVSGVYLTFLWNVL